MNKNIIVEKKDDVYKIYYKNSVYIGDIFALEDGFFYFLPDCSKRGVWSSHVLLDISLLLDELNKPIEEDINKYFE